MDGLTGSDTNRIRWGSTRQWVLTHTQPSWCRSWGAMLQAGKEGWSVLPSKLCALLFKAAIKFREAQQPTLGLL